MGEVSSAAWAAGRLALAADKRSAVVERVFDAEALSLVGCGVETDASSRSSVGADVGFLGDRALDFGGKRGRRALSISVSILRLLEDPNSADSLMRCCSGVSVDVNETSF